MKAMTIFENTVRFSLDESWQRNLTILNDVPLSAGYCNLDEMTGEEFLKELPELQLHFEQMGCVKN